MIKKIVTKVFIVSILFFFLISCTRTIEGFIPPVKDVKTLIIGVSTKNEIIERYGLSSLVAPKNSNSLLYMRQEKVTVGPEYYIIKRNVIAFKFNKDNTLRLVKILTKEDGENININSDKTIVRGVQDLSILQDILSNIGKFEP